jgi:peroxiredoxin
MLENDSNPSDPQETKVTQDSEGNVDRAKIRRRRTATKKTALAGPWPKISIGVIILGLALLGVDLYLLTRNTTTPPAPIIENIAISNVTDSSAVISWETNEPSTGLVTVCSSDNCSSTKADESLFVSHSVALNDIRPNTRYQVTISSKNDKGKEGRITLDLNLNTKKTIMVGSNIGDIAPDFTLPTIDGQKLTLSEFRGKVVMLNFWDTTCPNCQEETPYIQTIYDVWPRDKLQILAVSVGERAQFVKGFMDSRGLTFTALLDSDEAVKNLYNVPSFPTTYFIDQNGVIKEIKAQRFHDQSEIETILKSFD